MENLHSKAARSTQIASNSLLQRLHSANLVCSGYCPERHQAAEPKALHKGHAEDRLPS